jgi:subtilisin family serine protease
MKSIFIFISILFVTTLGTAGADGYLVKFSTENSLKKFLNVHQNAKRLHPTLKWLQLPASMNDIELPSEVIAVENNEEMSLDPEIEEKFTDINPNLWGLERIGVAHAWDMGLMGEGIVVAVLDSGLQTDHPAITSNLWTNDAELNGEDGVDDDNNGYVDDIHGYNFNQKNADVTDYLHHGSHVAGTIAGLDESEKFYGVAPHSTIMAVKTHNKFGASTRAAIISALLYAADNGARIINCSWSGLPEAGIFNQATLDAIIYVGKKGALVVSSAGNTGTNNDITPRYPGSYKTPNNISVASINPQYDNISGFSNFGLNSVHIAAPGVLIYSMDNHGGYRNMTGTSSATPHVSGMAAIVFQYLDNKLKRKATPKEVISLLMEHAEHVDGTDNKIMSGVGNLKNL